MATADYESSIARAQQALVDELNKARSTVQDERDDLTKQIRDLDGLMREIDDRLKAITGVKGRRTRVMGRGDQILAVLAAHGDPVAGDALLTSLTQDPGERARYGMALKKLQAAGAVVLDGNGYTIPAPE